MKTKNTFACIGALIVLAISGEIFAQDEERPALYVAVDCMKSTAADYADVETGIWQPIHQELVNQGKINSWSLYWVMYGDRSKCDYFTVTTYLGQQQLNAGPSFEEAFQAVHPDSGFAEAMARTLASRQQVATELWVVVDSTEIKEHRFAVVNLMKASDPDVYERMESRIFKPAHEALLGSGYRSGWAMYSLVSPIGTSIPYDYRTVDFSNLLSPVPMAEAMLAANPNRDIEAMHDLLQLRDQVRSQTWALVATTHDSDRRR